MYTRFMFNMVPIGWEKAAYPSLKPLASWVEDLILRVDFMNKWLTQGAPPAFWVSGFFFPQGFMTAVLQVYSRKHRIAIDTLKFRASVLDRAVSSIVEAPESGAFAVSACCLSRNGDSAPVDLLFELSCHCFYPILNLPRSTLSRF
jgi:dynein heavy chain